MWLRSLRLQCHEERIVPFSCKTRFCPSCGKVRTDEWVGRISQELLTVAAEAVRQVIAETYGQMKIGLIYTCHTFGRDLIFKPHIHLVMTKGGLKDGAWVDIDKVSGGKLAAKWRYLLCKRLRQLYPRDGRLRMLVNQLYQKRRGFQTYTLI